MKHLFKWIILFTFSLSLADAKSQFCGARLNREDQNKLYHLTISVLEEVFQEMKASEALQTLESLKKQAPQRIHMVGTEIKKPKGKIHLSLCYQDGSQFLKCSDIYKNIKENQKLTDLYDQMIVKPLKVQGASLYGQFIALEMDPKNLIYEGKPVSSDLHISLIKIRENPDVQKKVLEKLKGKIKDLGPFTLEKSSCRLEKKREYRKTTVKEPLTPAPTASS
jgi:hypothetical protein